MNKVEIKDLQKNIEKMFHCFCSVLIAVLIPLVIIGVISCFIVCCFLIITIFIGVIEIYVEVMQKIEKELG